MKLELKHLAPYFPHGLKVRHIDLEENTEEIDSIETLGFECVTFISEADFYFENSDVQIKPILRPLSDLTKEIEVNREKFVPIVKLFCLEWDESPHAITKENFYIKEGGVFITCSHSGTAMDTSINIRTILSNNYWKIEKLFEWHFDVFGLIEKELAIDINTLN